MDGLTLLFIAFWLTLAVLAFVLIGLVGNERNAKRKKEQSVVTAQTESPRAQVVLHKTQKKESAGGGEELAGIFGGLAFIALIAYGISMLVAAYNGIEGELGVFAVVVVGLVAVFFRFTLPITVAAFIGAVDVWGWDWYWALLYVLPGLAVVIPTVAVATIAMLSGKK